MIGPIKATEEVSVLSEQRTDLISRQAAIDSVNEVTKWYWKTYHEKRPTTAAVIDRLMELPPAQPEQRWIPVRDRLPIKEFEDGIKNGTVYDLYPCLVTRYSMHTDKPRTRTYVCKSYFDGEDFMLHGGYAPNEESDTENTLAWMPMMEPYTTQSNDSKALDALGEETMG